MNNLNRVRLADHVKWDYSYSERMTDVRCGDSPFNGRHNRVRSISDRAGEDRCLIGFALASVSPARLFHPLCSPR